MVRNVLDSLGRTSKLEHAVLVTGVKHYLGLFEAYASGAVPDTPFRESQGRQPVENFYYEQEKEDRLFEAAARDGFAPERRPDIDSQTLTRVVVDDRERAQTLTVKQRACDKVHAPDFVDGGDCLLRLSQSC